MNEEVIDLLKEALDYKADYAYDFMCKKIGQALAKLEEAQKPTSLGNTIRHIADGVKLSETNKDTIYQAARRLDRWWTYIQELEAQLKTKDELLFTFESVRAPRQND